MEPPGAAGVPFGFPPFVLSLCRSEHVDAGERPPAVVAPNVEQREEGVMIALDINGKRQNVDVSGETPLLWTLRDELGLTGSKFGCGMALCGACTVHVDGQPVRSCITPISSVTNKKIVTIEAVGGDPVGKALQAAWVDVGVPQCGYCQSGQIMSAAALLKRTPKPTDTQIDEAMGGNICRCGTYTRIRAAIKQAAAKGGA
jgi:isoquinoline 1-oxidoreductase alpha subunit